MAFRNRQDNNRGNRRGNFNQRGRGWHDNNRPGTSRQNDYQRKYPIGYKRLEKLVNDEEILPSDIALQLSTERSGLNLRLKTDMDNGMIQMLLKVFGKMCEDKDPNVALNHVLADILNSEYMSKLCMFLHGILLEPENVQRVAPTHVSNCLYLIRSMLAILPSNSNKKVGMMVVILENMMLKMTTVDWSKHDIENRFNEVKEMVEDLNKKQEKIQKREQRTADHLLLMHEEQPPDNFRETPVFPQINDIHLKEDPFVRTNLVNSKYQSIDHYLDVQFRLLREDFIRPLREGIKEFFQSGDEAQRRKRFQNIKMYEEVSILFPVLAQRGINHQLKFSIKHLNGVKWQITKRLMFGNLVCLSSDNFQRDFLFGVISDRKPEMLAHGQLEIEFVFEQTIIDQQNFRAHLRRRENQSSDDDSASEEKEEEKKEDDPILIIDMSKTYLMIETDAYFEAYRHVLGGLKEIMEIPMDRYIVDCNNVMRAPLQFRHNQTQLHFSSILVNPALEKKVNVLDIDKWPSEEEMGLDTSQRKALITGVTNELAIIQGPPGTGKTYVGLIIMKLLLENMPKPPENVQQRLLRRDKILNHSPMLVVCYTNHALDQFLEGIAKFHPNGIVRVGGRSKTKELEKYSLVNVKKEMRLNYNFRARGRAVWDHRNELQNIESQVEHQENVLKVSTDTLLKLQELENVISENLIDQFKNHNSRLDDRILIDWLGLSVDDNLLLKYPHVFYEVLFRLTHPLEKLKFDRNYVIDAILRSGEINPQDLINWMLYNQFNMYNYDQVTSVPEVVLKVLGDFYFGHKHDVLHKMGYHDIEVRCVFFILGNRTSIFQMEKWLSGKRKEYSEKNDFQQKVKQQEDDENVENEVDIIQEKRMLDDEYTIAQAKRKRQNEKEKREIFERFAALPLEDQDDSTQEAGGWQIQREERKRRKFKLRKDIMKNDVMTEKEAVEVKFIRTLSPKNRWRLYRFWVQQLRIKLRQELHTWSGKYNQKAKRLNELRREEDYEVLKRAAVIGMTTTGAAKYRDIVNRLPVKIVIVEEAAEVLEAHIVTAMPRTTEHLILIGDHQQLQPSPTVYELAIKFNLNVSLFERMMKNGIPFTKLSVQHRMRPQIANLIRPNIYRELYDADSVTKYKNIKGIQKNVFFITHDKEEQSVLDGRSKVNQHEADFLAALCQHILCQGYRPEQITILAAYTGQLFAFKNIMKKNFSERVRVTAVDNFQGEENDIILLSLVRSNDEGKIGFLKVENRVCVALSRARMGLYCIANFKMLEEKSSLWRNITGQLKKEGSYGPSLPLVCHNHPDFGKHVQTVEDFKSFPEGGCGKPCKFRLECGHVCTRSCHANDQEHLEFKCRKPCVNKCKKGHQCEKDCYEECGQCNFKVKKIIPKCQHEQMVKCCRDPAKVQCTTPCLNFLQCGHKCQKQCGEKCSEECLEKVQLTLRCGHINEVNCHLSETSGIELMKLCSNLCDEELKCGHKCKGTCGKCKQGSLHVKCEDKCTRMNLCGHPCKENCSTKCPPCQEKCQTKCEHSKCQLTCSLPCAPCKERCLWKCQHQKCVNKCSDSCSIKPCNKPCKKKKKCGHLCIGLCGEPCPKLCRICNKKKVTEIFFGGEDEENARFVELECGHIFTYENLDRWMNQDINATTDGENLVDKTIQLKECPKCKTVIRRSRRYGNIVNDQLKLINQIKVIKDGDKKDILNCKKRLQLLIEDEDLKFSFSNQHGFLKQDLIKRHYLGLSELNVIETRIEVLKSFALLEKKIKIKERIIYGIGREMESIVDWLFQTRSYFSDQEILDVECEVKKIETKIQYIVLKRNIHEMGFDDKVVEKFMLKLQKKLFENFKRFQKPVQKKVEGYFDKIKRINKALFIGLEAATRKMVIKAMNLTKGHWFECKNGHIYAIGECGGAQERGVCPECKDNIGGTGHRLAEGNRVATVMDGAIEGAYDEATRLNLVPENFQ